jgi:exonuclease III
MTRPKQPGVQATPPYLSNFNYNHESTAAAVHAEAVLKGAFNLAHEDKDLNELMKKIIGKEKNTEQHIRKLGLLGYDRK